MKVIGIVFKEQTATPTKNWSYQKHMEMDPTWSVDIEDHGVSITTDYGNFLYPFSQIVRIHREMATETKARGPGRPRLTESA